MIRPNLRCPSCLDQLARSSRDSGRSKGFAFVEMADDAVAQEAINQLNGREVDGRTIAVAEARPKREEGRERGGGGRRDSRW